MPFYSFKGWTVDYYKENNSEVKHHWAAIPNFTPISADKAIIDNNGIPTCVDRLYVVTITAPTDKTK